MNIWIDLANSPHALLFPPIARRLEELGHRVSITIRDNAQTLELARQHWPDAAVIGGETPSGRPAKALAIGRRMADLRRWARAERPDVALSHNSYAQIVAARTLRIPAVTAMDFEHQPSNHLAFRLARTVLLPDALRDSEEVRRQGAKDAKAVFYPGLKEEVYLGDFEPDPGVLEQVGVERGSDRPLVVARTPPSRAIYHRMGNPLFLDALRAADSEGADVVVLTRHSEQRDALVAEGLTRLQLPERAVDSRSLLTFADVVIGAGGTMTREAALLGTPTFTVFAGERPAVDRWLEDKGRLRRLEQAADLLPLVRRDGSAQALDALRERGRTLADLFARAALEV